MEIWSRGLANFKLKRSEKCVRGSKTGLWRAEGCGSGVEHLSSIYQVVGLIPSTAMEQKTKQEKPVLALQVVRDKYQLEVQFYPL